MSGKKKRRAAPGQQVPELDAEQLAAEAAAMPARRAEERRAEAAALAKTARHPETGRFIAQQQPQHSGVLLATGQAPATAHPVPGAPHVEHVSLHTTAPRFGPRIAAVSGAGPIASSVQANAGTVAQQVLDQAHVAGLSNHVVGRPTGPDGASPPDHVAPSGAGTAPGVTPPRGEGWDKAMPRPAW
jgi:hypothetical protein